MANLFFWRPWLACMESQCSYFEAHEPQRLARRDWLARYGIRIGLQVRAEAVRDGDAGLAEWALWRCEAMAAVLRPIA
jgi:hygromycin-B 4-O-kinase